MMSHLYRHRPTTALVGIVAAGGLVLAAQILPASAKPAASAARTSAVAAAAPTPPSGQAWIQGTLTDQASHRLNNVNVEAWLTDTTATEPIASNLSYAGAPADNRHQSGVYRLAVPAGTPYKLTFSTVGGREDGDKYRKQSYSAGRPIMARATTGPDSAASAVVPASGRVIDLGKTQLVRQGTVSSRTTVKLGHHNKVRAGTKGKLTVRVTSPFVSNVTGKVQARVGHKRITERLAARDHGRTTIKLPKLSKGGHRVTVTFKGTNTVKSSKAKPLRVKVVERHKR